jgi:hypothetical protein
VILVAPGVSMVVAVFAVLIRIRPTVLVGVPVGAVISRGARYGRRRAVAVRRGRCRQGSGSTDASNQERCERQNLRRVRFQSCHALPFVVAACGVAAPVAATEITTITAQNAPSRQILGTPGPNSRDQGPDRPGPQSPTAGTRERSACLGGGSDAGDWRASQLIRVRSESVANC